MATSLFWFAVGLMALGVPGLMFYRVFLSPLAKIPGPKIAAITSMYELYYDLVREGQFPWKLQELHRQYGPIVRISPDEVHINDPSFIPTHFTSSATVRRDKYPPHRWQLGVPDSTISTVDANLHRTRRGALAPFLSSRAIAAREPLIRSKVELVSAHLASARRSGQVVELRLILWYMATDIITELAYAEPMGLLAEPDNTQPLDSGYKDFFSEGQRKLHWFKHFPFLWWIFQSMPKTWLLRVEPRAKLAVAWETRTQARLLKAMAPEQKRSMESPAPDTVFEHLLRSELPANEKSFSRIWQDSSSLLGAGVETIANALSVIVIHLLSCPELKNRLKAELRTAIPDRASIPSFRVLYALPYLSAVVHEGLRKALGLTYRFIRVAPHETMNYGNLVLPPGTAVSVSAMLIHANEAAFGEAVDDFRPERWLQSSNLGIGQYTKTGADDAAAMDKKTLLLTFGKGPRSCLGMHLAHVEIYMVIATIFRRFDVELYKTGVEDIAPKHDSVMPMVRKDSKGVRLLVN